MINWEFMGENEKSLSFGRPFLVSLEEQLLSVSLGVCIGDDLQRADGALLDLMERLLSDHHVIKQLMIVVNFF